MVDSNVVQTLDSRKLRARNVTCSYTGKCHPKQGVCLCPLQTDELDDFYGTVLSNIMIPKHTIRTNLSYKLGEITKVNLTT